MWACKNRTDIFRTRISCFRNYGMDKKTNILEFCQGYIKILLKELYTALEENIIACYEDAAPYISDGDLKKMLETGVADNYEDQY